jgi:hypothetical protein
MIQSVTKIVAVEITPATIQALIANCVIVLDCLSFSPTSWLVDYPQVGAVHNVIHSSKVDFEIELFVGRYC